MSYSTSELLTRIRRKVQDETVTGRTNVFSDSNLTEDLKEALRHVSSEIAAAGIRWLWRAVYEFKTEADKEFYTLPGDLVKINAVRRTDISDAKPMLMAVSEQDKTALHYGRPTYRLVISGQTYDEDIEAGHAYWLKDERTIGIAPIPQQEMTMEVWYTRRLELPTQVAQPLDIPECVINPLVAWTSIVALGIHNEDAQGLMAEYEVYKRSMIHELKKKMVGQLPASKQGWSPVESSYR